MIQSMTGYGKAEAILHNGKLSIEIRCLNGKNAEVNLRTSLIPKDKDLELRNCISSRLVRGTIDVYLTWEASEENASKSMNMAQVRNYFGSAESLAEEAGIPLTPENRLSLLRTAMQMPEAVDARKSEVIDDEEWGSVREAVEKCLDAVQAYRANEGKALYADVTARISSIMSLYDEVEKHEAERIAAVRERLDKALAKSQIRVDKDRFEQELIFYLEKLDINEEKVRLRQHCKFFMDTIDSEPHPGKKLGFIIQEIGREINTTGSKANHAEIQKIVVMMKDELEKIREQSMNIL